MRIRNVLGLFDGISCGQLALHRAGVKFDNYYASEIDKYPISATQRNFPDTIQLGNINDWKSWDLEDIDLIIGGSPCQGFSLAGRRLNFDDERSKLFFVFLEIIKHYQPKYWMLENVKMAKKVQDAISAELGVEPVLINSGLVSAQSRDRLYWTNIPIETLPDDKGIYLKDKEGKLTPRGLCHIGTANLNGIQSLKRVYHPDGKSPTLTTSMGGNRESKVSTSETTWRKLTPLECERLQTLPDGYTDNLSNTQRYKAIGNGWTVDVISHIFGFMEE